MLAMCEEATGTQKSSGRAWKEGVRGCARRVWIFLSGKEKSGSPVPNARGACGGAEAPRFTFASAVAHFLVPFSEWQRVPPARVKLRGPGTARVCRQSSARVSALVRTRGEFASWAFGVVSCVRRAQRRARDAPGGVRAVGWVSMPGRERE